MQLTDWTRENLLATVAIFLAVATLTAVSAGGAVLWGLLALLGGGPVADAFETVLPVFVVGLLVGLPLTVVALVGVGYGLVSRLVVEVSTAVSDVGAVGARAVGRTARRVERRASIPGILALAAVADAVDPRSPETRARDRIERLQSWYVDGRLSEFEFERRLRSVLDDEEVSREQFTTLDHQIAEAQVQCDRTAAAVRAQLENGGVTVVTGPPGCTHCDADERWFSHRRDADAGRQAGIIALMDDR